MELISSLWWPLWLQAQWTHLRPGLRALVLDSCVGVEPLISAVSELKALTLLRTVNLDFAW